MAIWLLLSYSLDFSHCLQGSAASLGYVCVDLASVLFLEVAVTIGPDVSYCSILASS
jgi:hypothetical protein